MTFLSILINKGQIFLIQSGFMRISPTLKETGILFHSLLFHIPLNMQNEKQVISVHVCAFFFSFWGGKETFDLQSVQKHPNFKKEHCQIYYSTEKYRYYAYHYSVTSLGLPSWSKIYCLLCFKCKRICPVNISGFAVKQ